MGADNIAICPRCVRRRAKELKSLDEALQRDYGKVPLDVFDRQRAELNELRESEVQPTFAETWEIGLFGDGTSTFLTKYSGRCRHCQLEYSFEEYPKPWTEEELNS